jgi:hypothetical protein
MSLIFAAIISVFAGFSALIAPANAESNYSTNELVVTGNKFFGSAAGGLATVIERAVSRYGQPNGYILGEEGGGAIVGGLRYGEGTLHTRDRGQHKTYWQGPSIGWDFGGDGARVMMLIYNLPSIDAMYQRFGGVDGSVYVVGGFGMTALANDNIVVVPVRAGVGLRLGANLGYLKFTPRATWNPF